MDILKSSTKRGTVTYKVGLKIVSVETYIHFSFVFHFKVQLFIGNFISAVIKFNCKPCTMLNYNI